jgi:hypothetical protein
MRFAVLIGAHERDNFGDIASSAIMARVLRPLPIVNASILSSDARGLGGEVVVAARALKLIPRKLGYANAVIFFGGETLACDARGGLAMNLAEPEAGVFVRLKREMQARAFRAMTAGDFEAPAYVLPADDVLPRWNKGAPIIYHSVGGTELATFVKRGEHRRTLETHLKQASSISVRDGRTRALLFQLFGIKAQLFPDNAFALRHVLGDDIAAASEREPVVAARALGPYLVFQASARFLRASGLARAAARIGDIAERMRTSVVLQPAGLAWGHDDGKQLTRLGAMIAQAHPRVRTFVQRDRDFLVQTAVIAKAVVWIGTSLHGRIAAISMRVPAVSFQNAKIKATVETWEDELLPYDVTWDRLADATHAAVRTDPESLHTLASRLETESMNGLEHVRTLALSGAPPEQAEDNEALLQIMVASLAEENEYLRMENFKLLEQIAYPTRAQRLLHTVLQSARWRLGAPLRVASRFLSGG